MINIYEVIAIEEKLPLFLVEHINRFYISISNYKKIDKKHLEEEVIKLIIPELRKGTKDNIKLTYNTGSESITITRTVPKKPPKELYQNGAEVAIFHGERTSPLIKKEHSLLRDKTERFCKEKNLYDVLLMDHNNHITEGSRSNFLLLDKDNNIITSPTGVALKGITRDKIFKICKAQNISVLEKDITEGILKESESLLITGTSPEILPIIKCGSITFEISNSTITLLKKEFNKLKKEDKIKVRELLNSYDKETRE